MRVLLLALLAAGAAAVDRVVPIVQGYHLWNLVHDTVPGKRPATVVGFFKDEECRQEFLATRFVQDNRKYPERYFLLMAWYDYQRVYDLAWWNLETDMDIHAQDVLNLDKERCMHVVYMPPGYQPNASYPQEDETWDQLSRRVLDPKEERMNYEVWYPEPGMRRSQWPEDLRNWVWSKFNTEVVIRNGLDEQITIGQVGSQHRHIVKAGGVGVTTLLASKKMEVKTSDGRVVYQGLLPHPKEACVYVNLGPGGPRGSSGLLDPAEVRTRGQTLSNRDQFTTFTDATLTVQPPHMPYYSTTGGFKKVKQPPGMHEALIEFLKKYRGRTLADDVSGARVREESFFDGYSIINFYNLKPGMVYLDGDHRLKQRIAAELKPILAAWSGFEPDELKMTSFYGMREYYRGNNLRLHVDRTKTHVISAIINICQDRMGEKWPVEIVDFAGRRHNIFMEPGDLVLYESSKLQHGRPRVFHGDRFCNAFLHFAPKKDWHYIGKGDVLYDGDLPIVDVKVAWMREQLMRPAGQPWRKAHIFAPWFHSE